MPILKGMDPHYDDIQDSVAWCLKRYMTKSEAIQHIIDSTDCVTHSLAEMAWNGIEQEHPKFYKAYIARVLLHKQINAYNELLWFQSTMLLPLNPMFSDSKSDKGKGVESAECSMSVTQENETGSMSIVSQSREEAMAKARYGKRKRAESESASLDQEDEDMMEPEKETAFDLNPSPHQPAAVNSTSPAV